jgi:putative ABC transport system ATP-binding protein
VPAVIVRDLALEYERGGYVVRPIDDLDLTADDGQLVLLVGASGCGKTTLLSALASLLRPAGGTIHVGQTEVTALTGRGRDHYRRRGVGIVFQAFNLLAALTALDNVAVPMWNDGQGRKAKRRAEQLLTELGLGERLHHRPAMLSGGQQQRVAIARALALDPPLLLADEPTAHLDAAHVEQVCGVLRKAAAPGRVVVVATHDERLLPIADQVVELSAPRHPVVEPQRIALSAGELLFREGEAGDVAYVVESGRIQLVRQLVDGSEELVLEADPGRFFGELAPMYGLPRTATARAAVDSVVTACAPQQLRNLIRSR